MRGMRSAMLVLAMALVPTAAGANECSDGDFNCMVVSELVAGCRAQHPGDRPASDACIRADKSLYWTAIRESAHGAQSQPGVGDVGPVIESRPKRRSTIAVAEDPAVIAGRECALAFYGTGHADLTEQCTTSTTTELLLKYRPAEWPMRARALAREARSETDAAEVCKRVPAIASNPTALTECTFRLGKGLEPNQ